MSDPKRILFVDDEPYVLDGLRRMLRPMRQEWVMHFEASGADALALMETHPIDVIVSDMRMPGMNGAELLNAVQARHPRTVRLILSGHADDALILECVNATHQFLSKPCDPDLLRITIERLCRVEDRSHDERMMEIISRLDQLPGIPLNYDELLARIRDPDATTEAVAAVISKDPAMSAKVLKLVNSAFFGLRRRVVDLIDAVNFLGMDTLRSLALSVHAFSQLDTGEKSVLDMSELWRHSLATAVGAKAIATSEGADESTLGATFSAGLLHDIGRIVLAANFRDQYLDVIRLHETDHMPLYSAEVRILGMQHTEVGAALYGIWGLPDVIVDSTKWHHLPSGAPDVTSFQCPLAYIHAADAWLETPDTSVPLIDRGIDLPFFTRTGGIAKLNAWHETLTSTIIETAP